MWSGERFASRTRQPPKRSDHVIETMTHQIAEEITYQSGGTLGFAQNVCWSSFRLPASGISLCCSDIKAALSAFEGFPATL